MLRDCKLPTRTENNDFRSFLPTGLLRYKRYSTVGYIQLSRPGLIYPVSLLVLRMAYDNDAGQQQGRKERKEHHLASWPQSTVSSTCTAGRPVKQYYYNVSFNQHCSQQWNCAALQLCRSVVSWSAQWPLETPHTDNNACLQPLFKQTHLKSNKLWDESQSIYIYHCIDTLRAY